MALRCQVSTQPLAAEAVSLIDKATLALVSFIPEVNSKMNIEHRTLNVQRRIMYSINLKNLLSNTRRKRLRCASGSILLNLSSLVRFCGL